MKEFRIGKPSNGLDIYGILDYPFNLSSPCRFCVLLLVDFDLTLLTFLPGLPGHS
jgi:hypothetical protein